MNTPSPFIPGTKIQFAWNSTSLGWLKSCPRQYQYYQLLDFTSGGGSVHIRFGQHYHAGLEFYDKKRAEGMDYEEALDATVAKILEDTWDRVSPTVMSGVDALTGEERTETIEYTLNGPWRSDNTAKNRETLIRSIIWYLEHFKDDPAKTVILDSGAPAVELTFAFELDFGPVSASQPFMLAGHLDRVVEFAGEVYIMDHKTTGHTISSQYFDGYQPDNQMSLYILAGTQILNMPVKGIIIDAAQIAVGFTRFERGMTFRTQSQLDEWLDDAKFWMLQAEQFALNNHYPMNDKSCHLCSFRSICSKDPSMRKTFLESNFEKRVWNPLTIR